MTPEQIHDAVTWLVAEPDNERRVVLVPDDDAARTVRAHLVLSQVRSWQVIAPWQVPQMRHRRPTKGRTFRYAVVGTDQVLAGILGGQIDHLTGGPP